MDAHIKTDNKNANVTKGYPSPESQALSQQATHHTHTEKSHQDMTEHKRKRHIKNLIWKDQQKPEDRLVL